MKAGTSLRANDLAIDTATRRVVRAGRELDVPGLSFDLLVLLARRAPALVPMKEILSTVWPSQDVTPETVTQRVKLLRAALGDDGRAPRYIAGRRGHGYRLLDAPPDSPAAPLHEQARAILRGTSESLDQAVALLKRAVELDPDYAPALGTLAMMNAGAVLVIGADPSHSKRAAKDAEAALMAAPELPEARAALALVAAFEGRWLAADEHFAATLTGAPQGGYFHNLHCLAVLRPAGLLRRCHALLQANYRAHPSDGFTLHELGLTASLLGDDRAALEAIQVSRAIAGSRAPPPDTLMVEARAAWRAERRDEALRICTSALPEAVRSSADAVSFFRSLDAPGVEPRVRSFALWMLAAQGRIDEALDLANAWLDAGPPGRLDWSELWAPEMLELRQRPGFGELVRRLDLAPLWARIGPPEV